MKCVCLVNKPDIMFSRQKKVSTQFIHIHHCFLHFFARMYMNHFVDILKEKENHPLNCTQKLTTYQRMTFTRFSHIIILYSLQLYKVRQMSNMKEIFVPQFHY